MIQPVNLYLQGIHYILFTNKKYRRVDIFLDNRDANVVAAQGIISPFLDILDIVHITAYAGILGHIEQHLFLLLQDLYLFLIFLKLAELIYSGIAFS